MNHLEVEGLTLVSEEITYPACEICGQTISRKEYIRGVKWEGFPKNHWPRFHAACITHQIDLEHMGLEPYADVFNYT